MEPETLADEPAPIPRKPRGRPPKTAPAANPFLNEAPEINPIQETPIPPTPQAEPQETRVDSRGNVAPLLIASAFVLFLFAQGLSLMQAKSALVWQKQTLERQSETIRAVRDSSSALLQERQQLVEQSQRISAGYNQFLVDLIELAKTDKDAQATVEKFQIKSAGSSQESAVAK